MIKEFFKNTEAVFLKVTGSKNGTMTEQMRHFIKEVSATFYGGAPLETQKNWDQTFDILTQAIKKTPKNRKIVLFLDELPWLASKNSRFLQNLDYYWNQYWSDDPRIKLIVCGSSASWIIEKIINNRAGLHNRITCKIHLNPFDLASTRDFLQHKGVRLKDKQILQIYMVMGGIPYYLTKVDKGLSAVQIVEKLAFSEKSFLLEEFDNLFASLFDKHEGYVDILKVIAKSRHGIGQEDLLNKLTKKFGRQTVLDRLQALKDADFIVEFKPHFHKKRGIYYRVIDEYTFFYFQWIDPMKETLQERALEGGNWLECQNTSAWNVWSGYAFEAVCYKHLSAIRRKCRISPTAIANSWRYISNGKTKAKGAQIDLLFDRRDDSITLCEIKYTSDPFVMDKAYAENLQNKIETFKEKTRTRKQIFMVLISASGVKDTRYLDEISCVVTLADFFGQA